MYLLIPDADPRKSPSQADVISAVKALDPDSYQPFMILVNERRENSFFQLKRNSARLFEAEYAEGQPQRQFHAVKLSRGRVIEMVRAYLEGSNAFKQMSQWIEITNTVLLPEDHDVDEEDTGPTNSEEDEYAAGGPGNTASTLALGMAELLSDSGFQANYTLESLAEIDRLIDEHSDNGQANKGGLLAPEFLPVEHRTKVRLFSLGCYVGEVLCRLLDGHWEFHPEHPDRPELWQVRLPSGSACYPINKVFKRFANGAEDGLYTFGAFTAELEQTGNPGA